MISWMSLESSPKTVVTMITSWNAHLRGAWLVRGHELAQTSTPKLLLVVLEEIEVFALEPHEVSVAGNFYLIWLHGYILPAASNRAIEKGYECKSHQ